jgi:hypothetical protein
MKPYMRKMGKEEEKRRRVVVGETTVPLHTIGGGGGAAVRRHIPRQHIGKLQTRSETRSPSL